MNETMTLLNILIEVLDKKKSALELIKEMTDKQGVLIQEGKSSDVVFTNLVKMKQGQIDRIVQYDEGFVATYNRVKIILNQQPKTYEDYVKQMQSDIMAIGEVGVGIRVQEMRNMRHLEIAKARDKGPKLVEGAKPSSQVAKQRIDAYTRYEKK